MKPCNDEITPESPSCRCARFVGHDGEHECSCANKWPNPMLSDDLGDLVAYAILMALLFGCGLFALSTTPHLDWPNFVAGFVFGLAAVVAVAGFLFLRRNQ